MVCVDINPSTAIKLSDRGTFQTVGLVTDVEPFLRVLVEELAALEAATAQQVNHDQPQDPGRWTKRGRPAAILMCPPNYYGIEYEINPWMCRQRPCDHAAAVARSGAICGNCSKRPGHGSPACRR